MKDQELLSALIWHKSSASGTGNCVEVALSGGVFVRDSKDPQGNSLRFNPVCWLEFVESVRAVSLIEVSRWRSR
ncbi:DUF397 domain-containing protein [Streptomyces sp. NBC_00243]|uniref:DUF397 domain-containing protein n=1 Tax=Streptomyces sp. NBC_00243 TaxID=2975688 RepID=UPI002DDB5482|nr:DUF397 domain-containing protein [Streptomyces sp. NBC_00243]WRZ25976.1 DUF397 domain-containing protein [Streptomyces sp. NBC_00243]